MNDILQFMFQDGHLTATEVVALRRTCRELHENPVRVLRSLNIAKPEEIQDFIQRTYRVAAVTDKTIEHLDDSVKALVPIDLATSLGVFAVAEDGDTLHVAMEDPSDKGLIHKLEFFLDRRIIPVAATVHQILAALSKLYEVAPEQIKLATVLETSRGVVMGHREHRLSAGQKTARLPGSESHHGHDAQPAMSGAEEQSINDLTARALAASPSLTSGAEDDLSLGMESQTPSAAIKELLSDDSDLSFSSAPQAATDPLASMSDPDLEPEIGAPISGPEATPELQSATASDGLFVPGESLQSDLQPGEMVFFESPQAEPPPPPPPPSATPALPVADSFVIDGGALASDLSPGDLVFFGDVPTPPAPAPVATPAPAPVEARASAAVPEAVMQDAAALPQLPTDEMVDDLPDFDIGNAEADSPSVEPNLDEISPNDEMSTNTVPDLDDLMASDETLSPSPDAALDAAADAAPTSVDGAEVLNLAEGDLDAFAERNPSAVLAQEIAMGVVEGDGPQEEQDEEQEYSHEEISKLTIAINATLVKMTFAPTREKALVILNDKLGPLGLKLSEPLENKFRVEYQGRLLEGDLKQLPVLKEPLFDAVLPILRRLEKIRR